MSLSTRVSGGKPQWFLYAEIVAGACQPSYYEKGGYRSETDGGIELNS